MRCSMVVFITGLPGTGKSTLVSYFRDNPTPGWTFYDFDRGKYKIPPTDNTEVQKKQLNWWLNEIRKGDQSAVVMGFWGFPENLYSASNYDQYVNGEIVLGLLASSGEEIYSRMQTQGRAGKSSELTGWKAAFVEAFIESGAKVFDTESASVEETASEIRAWLEELVSTG